MSGADSVIDAVCASLAFAPRARRIVAYSGGLDSTVLLHALVTYARLTSATLAAIHVDHKLQPQSHEWAAACHERARSLGIDCEIHTATDVPAQATGVEQWARDTRYAVFARAVASGDVIVMAHHRDDLAETVLMRLMRGAGPEGLAGMPATRPLGRGHLLRPLLQLGRADIEAYAAAHDLAWSEDPSNADAVFDRNYVRDHVLPVLQARWPGAADRIAQAAVLQADAAAGLRDYADGLLNEAADPVRGGLVLAALPDTHSGTLSWVLRRWLEREGLPLPDTAQLHEMQRMVLARQDSNPLVAYKGAQVRRYRGSLYAGWAQGRVDLAPREWHVAAPLRLGWGELRAVPAHGDGIALTALRGGALTVGFRQGGERCRLPGRGHRHALKHLFQQWGVPPWQRADTPLIYSDGELVAVGGFCVCEPYAAAPGEESLRIVWHRAARGEAPPGITP
jgi:tRNA(Ile)-lysidine synthase